MKLRDVEDITHIREMSVDEAYKFVSRGQGRQITRNQATALQLMTWRNTREDWLRLQACLVILKQRRTLTTAGMSSRPSPSL
jgi:hypothetical protein